jgi:hypothetical protein
MSTLRVVGSPEGAASVGAAASPPAGAVVGAGAWVVPPQEVSSMARTTNMLARARNFLDTMIFSFLCACEVYRLNSACWVIMETIRPIGYLLELRMEAVPMTARR